MCKKLHQRVFKYLISRLKSCLKSVSLDKIKFIHLQTRATLLYFIYLFFSRHFPPCSHWVSMATARYFPAHRVSDKRNYNNHSLIQNLTNWQPLYGHALYTVFLIVSGLLCFIFNISRYGSWYFKFDFNLRLQFFFCR